jgi:hypothetical protein
MRAQVATFAGCPMPSQFVRRQAPKKISSLSIVPPFLFKCLEIFSLVHFSCTGIYVLYNNNVRFLYSALSRLESCLKALYNIYYTYIITPADLKHIPVQAAVKTLEH